MPVIIRTPSFIGGGGKIKDATALPEDVKFGKIFYNNQGRQEGKFDTSGWVSLKTIVVPAQTKGFNNRFKVGKGTFWIGEDSVSTEKNGREYYTYYNTTVTGKLVGLKCENGHVFYSTAETIPYVLKTGAEFRTGAAYDSDMDKIVDGQADNSIIAYCINGRIYVGIDREYNSGFAAKPEKGLPSITLYIK